MQGAEACSTQTPQQHASSLRHYRASLDNNEHQHHIKLSSSPPQVQLAENSIDETQLANLVQNLNVENNKSNEARKGSSNNNNDHHWLVFKQEPMPQRIIDAKKRLGQIKEPNVVPNAQRNLQPRVQQRENQPSEATTNQSSLSTSSHAPPQGTFNPSEKNWMQWDSPNTPENIKQIRARQGDDRYRKLSDRLLRCKTAQVRTSYEDYQRALQVRPKTAVNNKSCAEAVNHNGPDYSIPAAYQVEYSQPQIVQNLNVNLDGGDLNNLDEQVILAKAYEQHNQIVQQQEAEKSSNFHQNIVYNVIRIYRAIVKIIIFCIYYFLFC